MSDDLNPYQAPDSGPDKPKLPQLTNPQVVPASHGVSWLVAALQLLRQAPAPWMLMGLVMWLSLTGFQLLPVLGAVIASLIAPVFMAGFYLACRSAEKNENPTVNYLFSGFSQEASKLLAIGGVSWLLSMACMVSAAVIVYGSVEMAMAMSGVTPAEPPEGALELATLGRFLMWYIGLYLPFMWALFFAPALIVLHGISVGQALYLSFRGCLRNVGAMLMCMLAGFIMLMVIGIVAAIPIVGIVVFALCLVSMPALGSATIYYAYKDIFLTKRETFVS